MQIICECLLPAQLHVFIVKSYATLRYATVSAVRSLSLCPSFTQGSLRVVVETSSSSLYLFARSPISTLSSSSPWPKALLRVHLLPP